MIRTPTPIEIAIAEQFGRAHAHLSRPGNDDEFLAWVHGLHQATQWPALRYRFRFCGLLYDAWNTSRDAERRTWVA